MNRTKEPANMYAIRSRMTQKTIINCTNYLIILALNVPVRILNQCTILFFILLLLVATKCFYSLRVAGDDPFLSNVNHHCNA